MNKKATPQTLPQNPTQAARELVKISRALIALADRETQALIQNDLSDFSILQDEKELVVGRYTKASAEFRARIEEFRGLDRAMLDQMDRLQRELAEKTHGNNAIVSRMQKRSKHKAQSTLFTVQELAQQRSLRFESAQEGKM